MGKKFIGLLLGACLCACFVPSVASCESYKSDKIGIVCTAYPQYDWVLRVLGGRADGFQIKYLLENGVDSHSYQPSVRDIAAISSCGLFIYVGGSSDEWTKSVLNAAANADMRTIAITDAVEAKTEEIVDGMKGDADGERDEHVWLSLKNAQIIVGAIAEAVCALDRENAAYYNGNASSYTAELAELDAEYRTVADAGAKDTVLFCDRFPFRYLADDYGISYYAAFSGCSTETEAGFATVVFLAKKIDELRLCVVLILETYSGNLADTVIKQTAAKNQKILTMHSCQSVKKRDISGGATYLSIMRDNLDALRQALA